MRNERGGTDARSFITDRSEAEYMPSDAITRRQRIGQRVALAAVFVFAVVQFYAADPRPWGLAAAWGVGTALVFGPAAWLARDRVPPDRRETLTYVAWGVGILAASVWIGVALAFAPGLFPYGPGFLAGVAVGSLAVLVAERTVVPERLRGAGI